MSQLLAQRLYRGGKLSLKLDKKQGGGQGSAIILKNAAFGAVAA
jgi:hypothetical protein